MAAHVVSGMSHSVCCREYLCVLSCTSKASVDRLSQLVQCQHNEIEDYLGTVIKSGVSHYRFRPGFPLKHFVPGVVEP